MLRLATLFAIGVTVTATASARADCAGGADYLIDVQGTSVKVLPEGTARKCGGAIHVLRQDTATGEVVQLADHCSSGAYVDECVPPGTYRYGFATPYDCSEQGCGLVSNYGSATVTASAPSCTLAADDVGATPFTGQVPWTKDTPLRRSCPSGCGCSSPGRADFGTLAFDGAVIAVSLFLLRRRRASRA